jgi:hypothetical protein
MSTEKTIPLPDPTKIKTLEDLVFVGHIEREKEVFGLKIVLQNLTHEENQDALNAISGKNDLAMYMSNKLETLSRAIISINGIRSTPVYDKDPKSGENIVRLTQQQRMKEVLKKMKTPVVDKIFDSYLEVAKEIQEAVAQFPNLSTTPGAEAAGK